MAEGAAADSVVRLWRTTWNVSCPPRSGRSWSSTCSAARAASTQLRTYESTVSLLRSLREDELPPELRLTVKSFIDAQMPQQLTPEAGRRESATEMVQVVLPNDANPLGFILGGTVMHLIDIAGAIACHRHTRTLLVTAAVDGLQFLHPIKVGDLIILKSRVTAAWSTSLEVEVEVFSEET